MSKITLREIAKNISEALIVIFVFFNEKSIKNKR